MTVRAIFFPLASSTSTKMFEPAQAATSQPDGCGATATLPMNAYCSGPTCPVSSSPLPLITPSVLSSRANVSRVLPVLTLVSTWATPISVSVAAMPKVTRYGEGDRRRTARNERAADRQALGARRVVDGARAGAGQFPGAVAAPGTAVPAELVAVAFLELVGDDAARPGHDLAHRRWNRSRTW